MSSEFERDVMEKLGKLEAGLEGIKKQLLDNGQPGFITLTNKRLMALEKDDYRRTWIERSITAGIALVVSLGTFFIALRDHIFK